MMNRNTGRKMMVASAVRNNRIRQNEREMYGRNTDMTQYNRIGDYERTNGYNEREMRQRDSRGRYMMGDTYATGDYPEMRQRRDSRGRYMTGTYDMYDEQPMIGFDRDEYRSRSLMPMEYGENRSRMSAYDGDIYAKGSIVMSPNRMKNGMMNDGGYQEMDEMTAMKMVKKMQNEDGTRGGHFKYDQTEEMRKQLCPDCDQNEFFLAMNMMYSDYCNVAKQMGIDKPEYYAHMAKAFICDKDAKDHKLQRYFDEIVR